jgi:hypothetical protein
MPNQVPPRITEDDREATVRRLNQQPRPGAGSGAAAHPLQRRRLGTAAPLAVCEPSQSSTCWAGTESTESFPRALSCSRQKGSIEASACTRGRAFEYSVKTGRMTNPT